MEKSGSSFELFDKFGTSRQFLRSPLRTKNPLNSQNSPPPQSKTERELLKYQSSPKNYTIFHEPTHLQDLPSNNYYDKQMTMDKNGFLLGVPSGLRKK